MAEDNEIALDSTLILASPNTNTVTTQTGPSANVRAFFDQNGGLSNAEDGMYPAISIAVDLGGVSDTSSPAQALFAVGVLRDPVVQYSREGSSEEARRPYFLTKWSTVEDALEAFLEDFPAALSRATELDARIMSEARSAGSEEYVDLVGLSLRQVVASFDITTSEDPDAKDVKAFLKDIGTSSRANPVDALYASTPALLYLNPSLVGILLDPLLEAQSLSSYPHPYAVPDLGAQYPIATRIESEEHRALGLDSSASMLIMTYLHAQKSGEGHLLKKYHGLLKQWADFLVEHAASPSEFVTSDGLTQANNANLALKGILGVHAMSLINQALEKEGQGSEDTAHYAETAERLYTEWKRSAFISGRVISSYGQPDSWSSACNLYLARLLGADFVEDQIFDGQTAFLSSQLAATRNTFGLGHDSNDEFTVKSHWTMFTAATMTDTDARNRFVSIIHNRTFLEGMTPAFATTWDARSASTLGGRASIPDKAIQFTSGPGTGAGTGGGSGDGGSGSNSSGSKVNLGAIVGGAVGGLAALAFTILAIIFFIRKRKTKQTSLEESKPSGHTGVTTPPPVQPAATTQESTPGTVSSPLSNQSPASQVFVKPPLPPSASLLTTSGAAPSSPAPPSEGAASILAASTASSGAGRRSSISKSGSPLLGGQSRQQPERERPLSEAEDLRAEVLALRREMEEMRARTALSSSSNLPDEPPPQYSS
ncbi:glutaminase GtaA [Coprinopsis cinerea okayama7|uniref:Glutaminase GtaA n=1 Tax=Coprinopsis cinerea (strain Okayama-7 / 130 / ATCC MYA-4618 / FGSC 9003) TaxID=240176 RepID=A8N0M8_COPC7|nr:glutaminase GtaA [Coprinopsis cinerea okayama7\|eukprot:XP_001828360.2 glutaminase GtaA [Coprinopsis cinerea okayama7\